MTDDWDVPYRQSLHEALALLNGQWTVAVLATLALGERRYKDLMAEVNKAEARVGWVSHPKPVTDKVLTHTLQRAQDNGLIVRRAQGSQIGGSVWYSLTSSGKELLRSLRPLANWAQQNRDLPEDG
ncbi:winged helix-turn-helix transcriptional regulator [Amycolatopsis sp. H20-H5]|uniref:winged helix-turn-helix transcriptional regulator n=1 Tax=Amycolatopsis sp. H20-H5 TaxID=3046309 RepID=UPI002DBDD1C8|nr:helix-turn-helix domain-containing protein [Amycolatopsis sp. H20-H5]MEC3974311.1 helix-turn-helix domain-containing protein [Amycolatopsis sp. H20-H5]